MNLYVLLPFSPLFSICFVCVYLVPSRQYEQKSRFNPCFPRAESPAGENVISEITIQLKFNCKLR